MKKPLILETRLGILLWHYFAMVLVFMVEKPLFMLYAESKSSGYGVSDVFQVVGHGLPIDFSVAAYLLLLPVVLAVISVIADRFPFKKIMQIYDIAVAVLLSFIFAGDAALYPFWGYKLDAGIFFYLKTPGEAFASVSVWMVLLGLISVMLLAWLIYRLLVISLTPMDRMLPRENRKLLASVSYLVLLGPLFIVMRGGFKESTMNVGHAYYSKDQFLNHSAVNPAFSLLSSLSKTDDFSLMYDYLPEEQRSQLADGLFQVPDSACVGLLSTSRPNVLLLILEGFGADFIGELGGMQGVAPNMERLMESGVSFTSCYAGSYRTDRGLVCVINGHPGLPKTSIMKIPAKSASLPSMAGQMADAGYTTQFVYGGDINFTNMKSWLYGAGYETVVSDVDFSASERHSNAWGVNDGIAFPRLFEELQQRESDGAPWFVTFLSLSSHEPFEVPYNGFEEMQPNAFAYTDSCLGAFVDTLRNSPIWDNLLLVVTADHGFRYPAQGNAQAPHVHHIPFIMAGGAVSYGPCRFDMPINQADIAATVLSQMNLGHSGFLFSRNVLSGAYTNQFAFYTFNNGFCYIDGTGASLFDADAGLCVEEDPDPDGHRTDIGKAILQTLHDDLERR
ncbi:MAG: LTA synthase family protein [Bacteroidaceae bacterium]|nr:LTA synthase family protein [Bacteroidaceae bacterium]